MVFEVHRPVGLILTDGGRPRAPIVYRPQDAGHTSRLDSGRRRVTGSPTQEFLGDNIINAPKPMVIGGC